MAKYCLAYIATAIVFLGLDFTWLSQMQSILYKPALGSLLSPSPSIGPAFLFYLIYFIGVVFFCVAPALRLDRWRTALLNGALFGLCAYATYDLTNQATLRIWSTRITVVDLAWGATVTAVAATSGFLITRLMVRKSSKASQQARTTG
jgi:uncharacterized membrane protein